MLRRRNADDIVEPDEELEAVTITSSSNTDRVQKLMSKQSRERVNGVSDGNSDRCAVVQAGIICVKCGLIFFPLENDGWVVCPGCQVRQHTEPVEEVNVLNPHQDMQRTEKLMQQADRQKRRPRISLSRNRDTHFNDAKGQLSLQMGSVEYREYVEDLKEHSPTRADDQFHEALEKRNEQIPVERTAENSDETPMDEFLERKAQDEVGKRQWHQSALGAVALMAASTRLRADDMVVQRIGIENAALHDVTIRPAEYQEALHTLVDELSK